LTCAWCDAPLLPGGDGAFCEECLRYLGVKHLRIGKDDDPILTAKTRDMMQGTIAALDDMFNPPGQPKRYGLMFFVCDFAGTVGGPRTNYMATVRRADAIAMLEETLGRWKKG
jgi:hypothetical protein